MKNSFLLKIILLNDFLIFETGFENFAKSSKLLFNKPEPVSAILFIRIFMEKM